MGTNDMTKGKSTVEYLDGRTGKTSIAGMSEVRQFSAAECEALKLVHSGDEGSEDLKAFRNLRTQLMKAGGGKGFACLVVSVVSGGGSYVASNLAATIALDASKTSLLVDANIYMPSVDRFLSVPSQFGLTDYLDDNRITAEDIVYASGVRRMRIIPAGTLREGGTEKIHSHRMRELFNEIKNRYEDRFIIVDAPSAIDYDAEVRILSEICDFVLLVVPYGKVTEVDLLSAIEMIGKSNIVGIVYDE